MYYISKFLVCGTVNMQAIFTEIVKKKILIDHTKLYCLCTFLSQEISCTKSISRVDRVFNFSTVPPQRNAHKYQAFLSWRFLLCPLLSEI